MLPSELEEVVDQRAPFQRDDGNAWLKLAWEMVDAQRWELAIACFRETVPLLPDIVEAWANLGSLHRRLGQFDESIACFRQAIIRQPNNIELHIAMANSMRQGGFRADAIAVCEAELKRSPESSELWMLLGNVLQETDAFDRSIDAIERGILQAGRTPQNVSCLGIAKFRRGDIEQAVTLFQESIGLDPEFADAHFHLGMALLLTENYQQGWDEYEWRPGGRRRSVRRSSIPMWDGRPLAANQTLMLVAEQGLGDTVQLVRLATELKYRYGCKIVFQSPRALIPLLSTCKGIDRFIARDDAVPDIDCFLPLASLPSLLRYCPDNSKQPSPYIAPDPLRLDRWKDALDRKLSSTPGDNNKTIRIGLSWQGDPRFPADHCRSIPLKHLLPLTKIPNTTWISLQKGYGTEQLAANSDSNSLIDFGDQLDAEGGAFQDSLALMHQLDLVITSDTAVAHVAGAGGIPVWIAISYVPDWRWNLRRPDSAWYSSARLFRQPTLGDWTSVVKDIHAELNSFPMCNVG